MLRRSTYIVAGVVVAAALALGGTVLAARQSKQSNHAVTVPQGTPLHVRLNYSLSTAQVRPGAPFEATVSEPVLVAGNTVIPRGATVRGRVVTAAPSGHLKGTAQLQLRLTDLEVNSGEYPLHTTSVVRRSGNHKVRNWSLIGGGAGGGALIGAIAAGGKGALIGGPIGAGAGTLVAYMTGKKNVRMPAEAPLTFTLTRPLTIDVRG